MPDTVATPSSPASLAIDQRTEHRIVWMTLAFGAMGAAIAAFEFSFRAAAGVFIGAALSWLNFLLLGRGTRALVSVAATESGPRPQQAQLAAALLSAGRYILLAASIYVIFKGLKVPLVSILVGMLALGAATTLASLCELCPRKR
ncbi:MAG: hypothetical protein NVS9B4_25740 [Candidatus Acidiferrum sp.]